MHFLKGEGARRAANRIPHKDTKLQKGIAAKGTKHAKKDEEKISRKVGPRMDTKGRE
jgi:hypothetical protein